MMNRILLIACVSLLSACASSTKISQAIDVGTISPVEYSHIEIKNDSADAPDHFVQAVKSYLQQELKNASIFNDDAGNKVTINVVGYRMRSGFSRAMFGAIAGKDGIDSTVVVTDSGGTKIGESTVSSYNVMAIGGMEDIARAC